MNINFEQQIKDYQGNPILIPDQSGTHTLPDGRGGFIPSREFTLRDASVVALNANLESDKLLSTPETKTHAALKRGALTDKIFKNHTSVDLTPEEVVLLRKRIGEHYADISTVILYRSFELTGGV